MQAVKNTVPAIAEAMERLRSNMMIFKYQLLHIGGGKQAIDKSLKMYREHMAQYQIAVGHICPRLAPLHKLFLAVPTLGDGILSAELGAFGIFVDTLIAL